MTKLSPEAICSLLSCTVKNLHLVLASINVDTILMLAMFRSQNNTIGNVRVSVGNNKNKQEGKRSAKKSSSFASNNSNMPLYPIKTFVKDSGEWIEVQPVPIDEDNLENESKDKDAPLIAELLQLLASGTKNLEAFSSIIHKYI